MLNDGIRLMSSLFLNNLKAVWKVPDAFNIPTRNKNFVQALLFSRKINPMPFVQLMQVTAASETLVQVSNPPSACLSRKQDSSARLDPQSSSIVVCLLPHYHILFLVASSLAVHLLQHARSCLFKDDLSRFSWCSCMIFADVINHLFCGIMCIVLIWSIWILVNFF